MPPGLVAYIKRGCPYCEALIQTSTELNIPVTYLSSSDDTYPFYRDKFSFSTLPLILADGELLGGYTQFANSLGRLIRDYRIT